MKNYLLKDQGVCDKSQVKETTTHLQLSFPVQDDFKLIRWKRVDIWKPYKNHLFSIQDIFKK